MQPKEGDPKYRISCQNFAVKLPKRFLKVLNILPGPLNSFLLLGYYRVGQDVLLHIDAESSILMEHKFTVPVASISMITPTEVMALESRSNAISVFNLVSKDHYQVPFNFMNEESDLCDIFTFNKSKHICVVERGMYNDNRFKLSYFETPLSEESRPFQVYETDSEWNFQCMVRKGNQHSMVIWFKIRQDTQFEIKTFSLSEAKGTFNHYKIKNQIGSAYNYQNEIQTAVLNIWQTKPSTFCLACNTEKTTLGLKNKDSVVKNSFIWDVKDKSMRECRFQFDQKYNDFLIEMHSFGEFSVFRSYCFEEGKVQKSPCYYVHNRSEEIVASSEWECSYRVKCQYPGFGEIIVENQYENGDVTQFRMRVMRVMQVQELK